jgi:membrane protease YdiL (CAAX protease family)
MGMADERSTADRILKVIAFAILALVITALAGGLWSALLISNLKSAPAVPWSVPVMALLLWLMWSYLDGKGWPRSTSEARRLYLRANPRSRRINLWGFVAGGLSVVALAGYWIALSQLVAMPPNLLPEMSRYPVLTVSLMTVMASLVAPFAEEAAFRGYFQVALERQFRGMTAVMISSLVFALAHLAHGILWPKLLVYFMAGVVFGSIAYFTNSTLPAIAPHIMGDLAFFTLIWPYDANRRIVLRSGADLWFWTHVIQAVGFTALAVWAFRRLVWASAQEGVPKTGLAAAVPTSS